MRGPARPIGTTSLTLLLQAVKRNHVTTFVLSLAVFLLLLKTLLQGQGLSRYALTSSVDGSLVVGIAAMGETLVILAGGFDLSVGGIISFLNVVLATHLGFSPAGEMGGVALILALGAALGLCNGLLVVSLHLQPIIATLATSFVWSGAALLVLNQPGGVVPASFVNALTGDWGPVPAGLIVACAAAGVWYAICRHRYGTFLYASGGDPEAAAANGVPVGRTLLITYTLAGLFYGGAAVFLTAQTAGGDANIGAPLLLPVFAAVVIGGTVFGGGQGNAVASLLAGFILDLIGEVLFVLGVASFYTDIFEGLVLVAAVLATTLAAALAGRRREHAGATAR